MGRVVEPTFRVEYDVEGRFTWGAAAWDTKYAGRPSDANLEQHVAVMEGSTAPGGANEHLGITRIRAARIIRQSTGVVVAEYDADVTR